MKKLFLGMVAAATLAVSANAIGFAWLESKLSGKSTTIKSTWQEVDAAGWDFRSYTYMDPAGRVCTIVFTNEKGGSLDCDFPPKER